MQKQLLKKEQTLSQNIMKYSPTLPMLFFLLIILLACHPVKAGDHPIDLEKTSAYFQEIKQICHTDDGALWGENLWGPILLIDPQTRFAVANQADEEGLLEKAGDVYIGYFPPDKGIANSTTRFGNKSWMMVMYPLPEDDYSRNLLSIHELYHLLQVRQNLSFSNYNNDHMDNMDARILIKLEWRALEKAISANEADRRGLLTDALIFRNYRRQLYPEKVSAENELEVHEGLAEYTGHRICSKNNDHFAQQGLSNKSRYWDADTYVRSFGYHSGMLYAFMLDLGQANWRETIRPDTDLGSLAQIHYNLDLPQDLEKAYREAKRHFDYPQIWEYESRREQNRQQILEAYRVKFTRDTILTLEVPSPRIVFNPNNLVPLDNLGTVYPTMSIMAEWGTLEVTEGGCLFDWQRAVVSARGIVQENNILRGEGWVLIMNEGWKLANQGKEFKLIKTE